MHTLRQDIRYALRGLRRSPGFTVVAVLALALGIGANTAIFSAVNAVLLRPLRYEDPARIVWLAETSRHMDDMSVALLNFADWQERNRSFSAMGLVRSQSFTLTGGDRPQRLEGYLVSSGYFAALGVEPLLGRAFLPGEDKEGAARVAVLHHRLWRDRFASDPGVLGTTLLLNGEPTTVVGVMPAGFDEDDEVDLYVPLGPYLPQLPQNRDYHPGFYGVARLKPGVTPAAAQSDMSAVARTLAEEYPDSNEGNGVSVQRLTDVIVGDVRPALIVLLAAVGFVLLIACANVANLLLARAEARSREIVIRTSLGAGRWRLVRQMLTESAVLSLAGGLVGLLLAVWAIHALVAFDPGNIPRVREVGVDARVLAFAFGVSLLTGLLFGLAPALRATRPDLSSTLKEGATGVVAGFRGQHLRGALVVTEVALTLVLLVGAGLMLKSFEQLRGVDPGFSAPHVITMKLPAPQGPDPDGARWETFYKDAVERVATLPGVEAAAASSAQPLEGGGSESGVVAEGRPFPTSPDEGTLVQWQTVSPGYFRTMSVPLLRGRDFNGADDARAAPVAIIDRTLADKFWPGENPVGKRLAFEFKGETMADPQPIWREIVGVAGHVKHYGLNGVDRVQLYAPLSQRPLWIQPERPMTLFVRAEREPESVAGAVRAEVGRIDPDVPVYRVETMEQVVSNELAQPRFSSLLLGAFAGLALTLASVGIYGLVAYTVSRRTREIGLRMALGARAADVLRLVVAQGMVLVAIGLAVGLVAALVLGRLLASQLYAVSASDPATFAIVALLLLAVTLAASWIPARRATRVDPLVALRYD
jgi:putative ABC transport system permease protein